MDDLLVRKTSENEVMSTLMSSEQVGNMGLEQILKLMIDSVKFERESNKLVIIAPDAEAKAELMKEWKIEAVKVQEKLEEEQQRAADLRSRQRAEREKNEIRNQSAARAYLKARIRYARELCAQNFSDSMR